MKNYVAQLPRLLASYAIERIAGNRHVIESLRQANENAFKQLENDVGVLRSSLSNLSNLVENQFLGLQQILDNKFSGISSSSNLQSAAAEISLMSAGLSARHLRLQTQVDLPTSRYQPAVPRAFDSYLADLEAMHPGAFKIWKRLFENGKRSYYEQREESCSHRVHRYAMLFAAYIEIYGFGRILDVGCGPHGLPSYLLTRDASTISGLEPLPLTSSINFECVQGFNEFLPWPDESFHTVLSGTSLDHVLSLDASLAEVKRVLTHDGRYLVWLASVPGARPYDATAPDLSAIDEFHMFHFDRNWIEPVFERYFTIQDIKIVSQPGFDHVFYYMSK